MIIYTTGEERLGLILDKQFVLYQLILAGMWTVLVIAHTLLYKIGRTYIDGVSDKFRVAKWIKVIATRSLNKKSK